MVRHITNNNGPQQQEEQMTVSDGDNALFAWESAFAFDFGYKWENAYYKGRVNQGPLIHDNIDNKINWINQLLGNYDTIKQHTTTINKISKIQQLQGIMNDNFKAFSALVYSNIPPQQRYNTDGAGVSGGYIDDNNMIHNITAATTENKRNRSHPSVSSANNGPLMKKRHNIIENNNKYSGPVLHVTGGMFIPIINNKEQSCYSNDYEFIIGRSTKDLISSSLLGDVNDNNECLQSSNHNHQEQYDDDDLPSLNLVNLPGSQSISRKHAIIKKGADDDEDDDNGGNWIIINNSPNGTQVDNVILDNIGQSLPLNDGSTIRIGRQSFAFYNT